MAEDNGTKPQANEHTEGAKPDEQHTDWEAKYRDAISHSREWESRAKANKAAADELEALKQSQLSETEKLTHRAEKAEKALADLQALQQRTAWKDAASEKYGVPASLLSGDTEEAIEENAKALKAWHDPKPDPKAPNAQGIPNMGSEPSGEPKESNAQSFARSVKASGF
jgi:hypothetical protein|nr:MAG TPA: Major head protein [Bacteriophage sp.]